MQITERESQVLCLLCQGLTAKEVAAELYLSTHTIISHKKNLMRRLDAKNAVHLGVIAIERKLLKENLILSLI